MADKYKRVSLPKFESFVSLNIDDIVRRVEENKTVVRGWAYDKETRQPVHFSVVGEQPVTFTVDSEYRRDVIDMFELKRDQEYGFVLEIEDEKDQPFYLLNIATAKRKLQYRLERPNMLQPGTFIQRLLRSVQTRGFVGSVRWYFKRKETPTETIDVAQILADIETFAYQPKISVAVPVYNVEEKWLDLCVQSLQNQYYENWELCLADDASPSAHIPPLLKKYMAMDERIRVVFRTTNGHISEATNSALEIATGEYIGFMDNDDELAPQALYEVVKALNADRTIDFIYTDEDKITESGKRFNAFYKSNWNPELLLNHNYITHFVVVKRALLEEIGGLHTEFNGSQDYDFVLRATEKAKRIHHISGMMYHWRAIESSTALNPESKQYAYLAGQMALQAAMQRRNVAAKVEIAAFYGSYKINYIYDHIPSVSVILSNQIPNLEMYMKELLAKTLYPDVQFVLPQSEQQNMILTNEKIVYTNGQTRDEKIRQATGTYIVLLDAGLLPTKENWLTELMNVAQRSEIGAVTGRIVDSKYRIENVGLTIDLANKRLSFPEKGTPGKSLGYYYRIALPRNIQAASETCLLFKKSDYEQVTGIDEQLGRDVMGVDLSFQFSQQLQKEILYSSYAIFKRNEALKVLDKRGDMKTLWQKWPIEALTDPYQNASKPQL